MSDSEASVADPGSRAFLEAAGFTGFFTVGQLHAERCEGLPDTPGVYAVVRESGAAPVFMPRSNAKAWRGEDPTRPIDELERRWVPAVQLLYLGAAPGAGVRNLLKQRAKRFLRFGHGKVVGHWGGRFVWQLADHAALRLGWLETGDRDAREVEAALRARFEARYGRPPFANDGPEPPED